MEEKIEEKNILENIVNGLRGLEPRKFGGFTASLDDVFNIVISTESGWKIQYPFGSETWAILAGWMERWNDSAEVSMENFMKVIVYPASVRLLDIDEEYCNSIVKAHTELSKRVAEKKQPESDEKKGSDSD